MLLFAATAFACPGSHSPIHAGANMNMQFTNSCAEVAEEIKARAQASAGEWKDPHNGGTYTLEKATDDYIRVKRVTANKVFTDRSDFKLSAGANGGCNVVGCSESQGISAADKGTNVCDMYNLFCNSKDCGKNGNCCKVLKNDLQYQITKKNCYPLFFSCPNGIQGVRDTCLVTPATEEELLELQIEAIKLQRLGAFRSFVDEEAEDEFNAFAE